MDSLRLSLGIIGFVIVVGLYFKYRSKTVTSDNDELIPVLTPIDDEPDFTEFEKLSRVISGRDRVEELSKTNENIFSAIDEVNDIGQESLLIVLNIMTSEGQLFSGEDIHSAMTSAGLIHGEHQIYHKLHNGHVLFSIANAIEPGNFALNELSNIATPGLAIFMQLPGPLECRLALDNLLDTSKQLAETLQGELCDESRSVLTQQAMSHLKEKVEAYRLKQQASQRRMHNQHND